ncbi:hypothetical protein AX17_001310 [Amanita inopinata Kibby_2008]|nr:hypothetical protein AX17_001310 [Amanita inopinata Kibby_2008]
MTNGVSVLTETSVSSSTDQSGTDLIKHAAVTYGRRRNATSDNDPASTSHSSTVLAVHTITQNVDSDGPACLESPCLLPESDNAHDEGDKVDGCSDTSTEFVFDWKRKLKEMDDDDELNLPALSTTISEGSCLTVGGIVSGASTQSSPSLASSSPVTPEVSARRSIGRRAAMGDTDSESEAQHHRSFSSSAPYASPSFVIQTPTSRSSPTPPTSDDDMPVGPTSKDRAEMSILTRRSLHLPCDGRIQPGPESGNVQGFSSEKRGRAARLKAPTKKEIYETAKSRVRLAADQKVSIPKCENSRKFTIQTLFASIAESQPKGIKQQSDPIVPFSSSPSTPPPSGLELGDAHAYRIDVNTSKLHPHLNTQKSAKNLDAAGQEDKLKGLQAIKERALALQQMKSGIQEDEEEDDLDIIGGDASHSSNMASPVKRSRPLKNRGQQLLNGRVVSSKSEYVTADASVLRGPKTKNVGNAARAEALLSQNQLSKMLAGKVQEQNKILMRQKEEEWLKRGGQLKNPPLEEEREDFQVYVQRGLQNSLKQIDVEMVDGDDSQDEAELQVDAKSDNHSEDAAGDAGASYREVDEDEDQEGHELDVDESVERPKTRMRSRHILAVLDSDSDSEEPARPSGGGLPSFNFGRSTLGSLLTPDENDESSSLTKERSSSTEHRGSVSSLEDQSEDRSDKENNYRLMFDRSEDKENKAVIRHVDRTSTTVTLDTRQTSLFDEENYVVQGSSTSPGPRPRTEGVDEGDVESDKKQPLSALIEDNFSTPRPDAQQNGPFTERLSHTPLTLEKRKRGFSQFSLGSSTSFGAAPLLQSGFGDLFESGSAHSRKSPRASRDELSLFKEPKRMIGIPCDPVKNLGLTQDIVLQPAFQAGDDILRKADSIFEKEQAYLLKVANKDSGGKQLYVNDFGFLTQTRPDDGDLELYKSPFATQKRKPTVPIPDSPSKGTQRQPLSTLSLSIPAISGSPNIATRRRLIKRRSPSPKGAVGRNNSPSPSPVHRRDRNAFDALAQGAKLQAKQTESKAKFEKSEYVEAEAEESDDDDLFGFGRGKRGEEEEDGEDLDQTLETLVDDRDMDGETLAAQLVLEKYKEHEEQDDQELERLHQAAAQGELRRKRRNRGIGLDDSDEESDEDERNRRIRRRMNKKQRIDRDNIKALAESEETKSFYQVYAHDLIDNDDLELAYLQRQDVVMNEPNDEEDRDRGYVTREEIEQRVREVAHQDVVEPTLDLRDVSWIDGDMSDGESNARVKMINAGRKKPSGTRHRMPDVGEYDNAEMGKFLRATEGDKEKGRMQLWARTEGKTRSLPIARSAGGVAVTGHAKSKATTGVHQGATLTDPALGTRPSGQRKPLQSLPSMLAGVSDRSSRFD